MEDAAWASSWNHNYWQVNVASRYVKTQLLLFSSFLSPFPYGCSSRWMGYRYVSHTVTDVNFSWRYRGMYVPHWTATCSWIQTTTRGNSLGRRLNTSNQMAKFTLLRMLFRLAQIAICTNLRYFPSLRCRINFYYENINSMGNLILFLNFCTSGSGGSASHLNQLKLPISIV